jgi:uncharacterized protein
LRRSSYQSLWESRFEQFVAQRPSQPDVAHDFSHVRRVVSNARRLTTLEDARMEVVLPAVWLHDCLTIAKDSPLRPTASALADCLDALGAIGIARCLMLGGAMKRALYDQREPFPGNRISDDTANVLDHFYTKLLRISSTMTTEAGRAEAQRRTDFMRGYLRQLGYEIRADDEPEEHY